MVIVLTHSMMYSLRKSAALASSKLGSMEPGSGGRNMFNFIVALRSGSCAGVRIRTGRLQEMVATSCVESLDFLTAKLEMGYHARGQRKVTWQTLLGGLVQRKQWDSKLTLRAEKSLDIKNRNPAVAAILGSPSLKPSATKESVPEILSLNDSTKNHRKSNGRISDYKLKDENRSSSKEDLRNNIPIARKSPSIGK